MGNATPAQAPQRAGLAQKGKGKGCIAKAKQGKAVVMVSSEMPELLGVCNRIVVMSGGRVAGEVDADNTTQEEIMTLAAKYA